jgi:hypothetical protein
MPLPQTYVAVAKFGYRCRPFWLLAFKYVNHIPHCLTKELNNPSYTPTTHTKDELLDNHKPVDIPFAVWSKMKTIDLSLIYWLSKLYKCATKQLYITGFLKYDTKSLFQLLTSIIPVVKAGITNTVKIGTPDVISIRCEEHYLSVWEQAINVFFCM